MHKQHIIPLILVAALVGGLAGLGGGFYSVQYTKPPQNSPTPASSREERTIKVTEDSATVDVVKRVSPAVVSIVVSKELQTFQNRTGNNIFPFDDFFEFGFPFRIELPNGQGEGREKGDTREDQEKKEKPRKEKVGGGSGFIVDASGLILTNKHVVSDTDAEYTVVTGDGKEYAAKVLARDAVNDIAIVKIDAKNLSVATFGDSDALDIGQTVIAIGYSLGEYRNTVTRGVISGIDRVVQATDGLGRSEVIQEAIQTDAAINPGNSGGPLLDLAGNVIGINTAVNRAGQSIGFSIPINIAKRPLESVKKSGRIIRPCLGVRYRLIDEEYVKKNNLSVDYGALIVGNPELKELGIVAGSPAQKAGLREGDIILLINGERVDTGHALANTIARFAPGDTVQLRVLSDGRQRDVSATLEEFNEARQACQI
jgi:serine protease Do